MPDPTPPAEKREPVSAATLEAMVEAGERELAEGFEPDGHEPFLSERPARLGWVESIVRAALDVALASGELVPRQEQEEALSADEVQWLESAARIRSDDKIAKALNTGPALLALAAKLAKFRGGAALSAPPEEEEENE